MLFGVGAAISGWSVLLLIAWLLLATTVGVVSQRATSWTCPRCGASVVPPSDVVAPRLFGGRSRDMKRA